MKNLLVTRMSSTRQCLATRTSTGNAIDVTSHTFSQFMFTMTIFFRQSCTRWAVFVTVTMMHYFVTTRMCPENVNKQINTTYLFSATTVF